MFNFGLGIIVGLAFANYIDPLFQYILSLIDLHQQVAAVQAQVDAFEISKAMRAKGSVNAVGYQMSEEGEQDGDREYIDNSGGRWVKKPKTSSHGEVKYDA